MNKDLNRTPNASRTHIGFFGRMNAGKSSLINALTDQPVSIVSGEAGTTTDVVKKAMEIHGIGPCVLLDTAGFDDRGDLGSLRTAASEKAADSVDIAVLLCEDGENWDLEKKWLARFAASSVPVIPVFNRADVRNEEQNALLLRRWKEETGTEALAVSAAAGTGLEELMDALIRSGKGLPEKRYILGDLVKEGDLVLLVMPQDPQAPEGRLILPEVQTIREVLDRHCLALCIQPQEMPAALERLKMPPDLIVTDSQVFEDVYRLKPENSRLTSFSVLFAAYKGDIRYYSESVRAIEKLTEDSRVLIAECCTHAPLEEDIGRVKIPRMLRKRVGEGLTVDITAGADFPEDVDTYDLIIQCGGCMFNRKYVNSRIDRAKQAGVPMTNYGITIAYVKGILDRIETGE